MPIRFARAMTAPPYARSPIADQEAWVLPPWRRFDQLAPHPVGSGMARHIDVLDPAPTVRDKEEDIDRLPV